MKAYLRQEWTDPADGKKYEVNDSIELPHETEEDRVTFQHLVDSGIIGRRAVSEEKAEELTGSEPTTTKGEGKGGRTSTTRS